MVFMSKRDLRTAARWRALRSMAHELRRLPELGENCWIHEHPEVSAVVSVEADRMDRAADRIAERHPWVQDEGVPFCARHDQAWLGHCGPFRTFTRAERVKWARWAADRAKRQAEKEQTI